MLFQWLSRIPRILAGLAAAAVIAASLPQAALAASVPTITILSVKAGESVKVRGENFPKNTDFTVRMDVIGNQGIGGTVIATTNSASGSFEAEYAIPAGLKNERTIAIRLESASGWFSYNWFTNNTSSPTATPAPLTGGGKPYIDIIGVEKNKTVTVQANRFPAGQTFTVRVGPFKDFFKKYVETGTIYSGNGGSFKFSVNLPESVKDVDMITIRLDSKQGAYAFNAFKNVNSGTVVIVDPPQQPTGTACSITATAPSKTLKPREDFDATWTVKNTGSKNWEMTSVDYKYISGSEMQKYGKAFDFKQTVKPGESIKIMVDMLAPDKAGTYTTTWAIVQGSATLCSLPLTIVVK